MSGGRCNKGNLGDSANSSSRNLPRICPIADRGDSGLVLLAAAMTLNRRQELPGSALDTTANGTGRKVSR